MDADLVFIHGFWSSPATWDRLRARLQEDADLAGLRIHAFGYESPKLRWPGSPTRIPDYNDIAQSLPAYLAAHVRGSAGVAVVTHSQGGLILQRYLDWMLAEGRGRELATIRLIVMLSCPNEGSEYLRSIRAVAGLGHHPQAGQLDVLTREVGEARRVVLRQIINAPRVDERYCPIPVYVYSGRTDNVVLRETAQSVFPNAGVLPGDHFSILDPDAPGHLTFDELKRLLLETFTTAGNSTGLATAQRPGDDREEMAPPFTADDDANPEQPHKCNAAESSPGHADPIGAVISVQSALTELGRLLAELIPVEDEAKRIVRDSGNTTTEDWWSRSPRSFWDTALAEAHRAWRMEALFASADEVLAGNFDWRDAKAQYLNARAATRRSPRRYLAPLGDEASTGTFSPYEASLQTLEKALDRIVPAIFRDPRISAAVLNAASAALVSLDPLVEALRAAAEAETQQRPRFELQKLDGSLRRHQAAISQKLSALHNVRSETAAEPLCHDLAVERAGLLAIGAQAIRQVT
jgi:Alpha/beta hydrolase family